MQGVCEKFTYVRYYLSDALMVDLFLLSPTLCFRELSLAVAEFVALSEALASVVPNNNVPGCCLTHCMIYNTQSLEHIESMHDKVAQTIFDTYRNFGLSFSFVPFFFFFFFFLDL
jgi:hypothetical protein